MGVQVLNNVIIEWGTTAGSATYSTIPGVFTFQEPGMQAEMIDATDFDTVSGVREKLAGLIDGQPGTFSINYVPGNSIHEAMRVAGNGRTKAWYRILLDDVVDAAVAVTNASAARKVSGQFYTQFVVKGEVAGKLEADVTITPIGALTFA